MMPTAHCHRISGRERLYQNRSMRHSGKRDRGARVCRGIVFLIFPAITMALDAFTLEQTNRLAKVGDANQ